MFLLIVQPLLQVEHVVESDILTDIPLELEMKKPKIVQHDFEFSLVQEVIVDHVIVQPKPKAQEVIPLGIILEPKDYKLV